MPVAAVPVSILTLLPANYSFVAAAAASTFLLHFYQILTVSRHRKAAGIAYPQFMAEKAEMENSPAAKNFNCAQRAHGNTMEVLPQILVNGMFAGLSHPLLAASFLATWVVGRFLFTYGYQTGSPQARYHFGGQLHLLGWAGTWFLSTYVAGTMVYATLTQ